MLGNSSLALRRITAEFKTAKSGLEIKVRELIHEVILSEVASLRKILSLITPTEDAVPIASNMSSNGFLNSVLFNAYVIPCYVS